MKRIMSIVSAALLCASAASAYEIDNWENHPIQIHGSFAQGYIYSTENHWLHTDSADGEWGFNDFYLNGSIVLNDSLTAAAQIISRDFGETGNNDLELDWAYFDYNVNDAFGLRVGRVKQALGLYGDYWDLDISRTTINLGRAYPIPYRDLYVSMDGASAYGSFDLGNAGMLSYDAQYGTKKVDEEDTSLEKIFAEFGLANSDDFETDYLWGGRLIWDTPVEGLRLAGSISEMRHLETETDIPFLGEFDMELAYLRYWILSAEYTRGDWIFTGEFSRTEYRFDSTIPIPGLGGRGDKTETAAYYIQAEKQITDKFAAAVGLGESTGDWDDKFHADTAMMVTDYYISTRFDVTDNFILKFEGHYLHGFGETYSNTNPDFDPDETDQFQFLTKAIFYF